MEEVSKALSNMNEQTSAIVVSNLTPQRQGKSLNQIKEFLKRKETEKCSPKENCFPLLALPSAVMVFFLYVTRLYRYVHA